MAELLAESAKAAPDLLQAPPLSVSGLCYSSGGRRLIDQMDFTINSAGVSAIMGPNGAGKSLLVRLLHGLIKPAAGTVLWHGERLDRACRARQAMVFQKPVMLRRSVAENIDFVLKLKGERGGKKRNVLLEQAGLLALSGQPARALSGGEQQRLAMVRALASRPETLFLDEPTASLDPASAAHIEALIAKARDDGVKVFLVTHDSAQARRLAHDVLFLHHGRLLEQAGAAQFFTRPESPEAKAFLEGRLVL